ERNATGVQTCALPICEEQKKAALIDAIEGLRVRNPLLSASIAFTRGQKVAFIAVVVGFILMLIFARQAALIGLAATCTFMYLITLLDRFIMFSRGIRAESIIQVSDEDALA